MFYVGKSFNPADGGYKTINNAKKAADKINANVYDESGVIVYPEAAGAAQNEAKQKQAEENTAGRVEAAETAHSDADGQEIKVELTDDVPDGALETNEDGSVNTYNEAGEKVGTISAAELEKLQAAAGEKYAEVDGTVTVVRDGLLAIRNAASWEDGHKCGIAKTGYKAAVVARFDLKGGALYQMANGCFISGKEGDTVFNAN